MKRIINSASTRPNKTKLRSEFVRLATQIRDMSKYEFVELLKNNDFETAQEWIDKLNDLYEDFSTQASSAINYIVAKVIVDGKFVGYVATTRKVSGSRMWSGRVVLGVSHDINNAIQFASIDEAERALHKGSEIGVWAEDNATYYRYEYTSRGRVTHRHDTDSRLLDADVFDVGDIHFEYEEI